MKIDQIRAFKKNSDRLFYVVLGAHAIRILITEESSDPSISMVDIQNAALEMTRLLGKGWASFPFTSTIALNDLGDAPTGPIEEMPETD